ncbi:hypothetical protein A3J19_02275 [Candidatus Daviesbacteria bacterium RIFCSPLOWO2_02_FULL_41_8]|uniref:Uncharacterized protein n=3 Tax=Candidatus Daviesiibacteriota TaxID=1752718 RepID=A0A1F5NI71_9BACT|nr:MAG: hypothetical protein A2871_01270 [Candidatus Daviesbacteria bacterium RIFCSPHIGHO2_01_FULL_41_23]OGE32671.1 MAG: hypothetical protein A3D83_01635 [Candidatus Daviesbacteria bacterium RIFCSPHIGHO2_02_FULL_41_10]OGE62524.1 MAG: hypothetical protein A2967_01755 [Candidatus Daviesbacteria bacterium RIFCSPLOWO2_01_FULL_41_32]OGE77120.1 MAG: hypothetical protein A3J19_02275 [Candidatus Daviesbacteria bacterium RIFCSPLOWO2_02_FULL_41_8]
MGITSTFTPEAIGNESPPSGKLGFPVTGSIIFSTASSPRETVGKFDPKAVIATGVVNKSLPAATKEALEAIRAN